MTSCRAPGRFTLALLAGLALCARAGPASASPEEAHPLAFSADTGWLTPDQAAALRRATAEVRREAQHPEQPLYTVAQADLNDDGRPDLIVQYSEASGYCGGLGCSGLVLMATPEGHAPRAIDLPNFWTLAWLTATHGGLHDLQFNGNSPVWRWNGRQYAIAPADRPGANAPAWQTRQAAGHTLALGVPTESVIQTLGVFCDQGRPVLAMRLKAPRPARALTLSFLFRGWGVNVPMSPGDRGGTLWRADLSRSTLPQWLAHRGDTPPRRELARLADRAFLRIDGEMQGQISLQNSASATGSALAGCDRR